MSSRHTPHSAPLSSLSRLAPPLFAVAICPCARRVSLVLGPRAFALGLWCLRPRFVHSFPFVACLRVLALFGAFGFFVLCSLGPSPFILGSRLFVRNSTASIGGLCFSARAFALSLSRAFALGLSRTFALGLYLCSRLVPVLSACELSAYAFAPGSVVIIPRLLASIPFSFGRRVLASLGSTFFVSLGLCTSLRASVPRFGTLLCLASGLCDSLWDFCALFQAFVPFFGFSLGLLRTSFGPPRLLRPTFSFGVLIFA